MDRAECPPRLTTGHALLVDDDPSIRRALRRELERTGFAVHEAADAEEALHTLRHKEIEAVLLDIRLPGVSGVELLPEILRRWPSVPVIMLTGHGDVDTAVACMRAGAEDFLQKPCHLGELEAALARAVEKHRLEVENRELRRRLSADDAAPSSPLIGQSAAIEELRSVIARIAPTEMTVLITGESGTGKEVVAREIVAQSRRARGPFLTISCATLAETLLESELFGHERGAFTGAHERRLGHFELADGGTLFLDEVGEMSPAMQAKLLRALQFGEYMRVGSSEPRRADVRILAATNRDLAAEVQAGRFREDLLYRLNTVTLQVPPLRARIEDLPSLAEQILATRGADFGRDVRLAPETVERLCAHPWPGNIRELENALSRAAIMCSDGVIRPEDLPPTVTGTETPQTSQTLDEVERHHILSVLEQSGGNKTEAARRLGITKKTLYSKLVLYGRHVRGE